MPMAKWISSQNSRVSSDFSSHGMTISWKHCGYRNRVQRASRRLGRAISQMEGDRANQVLVALVALALWLTPDARLSVSVPP